MNKTLILLISLMFCINAKAITVEKREYKIFNTCTGKLIESTYDIKEYLRKSVTLQPAIHKINQSEFNEILKSHKKWLIIYKNNLLTEKARTDSRRANLCKVDLQDIKLSDVNLSGADLRWALLPKYFKQTIFSWADLSGSDISGAFINSSDFSNANLSQSNLSGSRLDEIDFSESKLLGVNLNNALIKSSIIKSANLSGVTLINSAFYNVDFSNTIGLVNVVLKDTIFDKVVFPSTEVMANFRNLEELRYYVYPQLLIKLRKSFDEAGYFEQAKAITCAIKRSEYSYNYRRANGYLYDIGGFSGIVGSSEPIDNDSIFDLPKKLVGLIKNNIESVLNKLGIKFENEVIDFNFKYIFLI